MTSVANHLVFKMEDRPAIFSPTGRVRTEDSLGLERCSRLMTTGDLSTSIKQGTS